MNRSEDNTCETCKRDLPREEIGLSLFCSSACEVAAEDSTRDTLVDIDEELAS